MSALRNAYDELLVRRRAAEEPGDWHEVAVLDHLVSIADYLARIGDVTDSAHYRADKAGPLLDAAIRLQEDVFLAAGAWPEDGTPLNRSISGAIKALVGAGSAVRRALWDIVQSEHDDAVVYQSTRHQLTTAARAFLRWAESVWAVPDPDPQEGSW